MDFEAEISRARAAFQASRFDVALQILTTLLSRNPDLVAALNMRAQVRQILGDFVGATEDLERSLRVKPGQGSAFYALVNGMRVGPEDSRLIEQMELALLNAPPNEDGVLLRFALGQAYDDLGRYQSAIAEWDSANALAASLWFRGRSFDRDKLSAGVDWTLSKFDEAYMARNAGRGSDSALPVVVVGMMRSGTTLAEQVLSSHPDVAAGGELPFWITNARELLDRASGDVSPEKAVIVAEAYLGLLKQIGPGKARVVDKMPQNYMLIGLIHLAFPNARILHVRRHPVDNCLSIYSHAYQKPPEFALNRANIAFAYRQYARAMAHWRRVLPGERFMEIEYEELVRSQEPATRRMVEFCGIPWDDACLTPERNPRAVQTPSLWQVRQPIYDTSIGRWRNYEPWLGEFAELL